MRPPNSKVNKNLASPNAFSWALAISEAERLIQEEQKRVKRLKRSVRIFRDMEKRGVACPAGSQSEKGAMV